MAKIYIQKGNKKKVLRVNNEDLWEAWETLQTKNDTKYSVVAIGQYLVNTRFIIYTEFDRKRP